MLLFDFFISKNKVKVLGLLIIMIFCLPALAPAGDWGVTWSNTDDINKEYEKWNKGSTSPHSELDLYIEEWGITICYKEATLEGIALTVYDGGKAKTIDSIWGIKAIYQDKSSGDDYLLTVGKDTQYATVSEVNKPDRKVIVFLNDNFLRSLNEVAKFEHESWKARQEVERMERERREEMRRMNDLFRR